MSRAFVQMDYRLFEVLDGKLRVISQRLKKRSFIKHRRIFGATATVTQLRFGKKLPHKHPARFESIEQMAKHPGRVPLGQMQVGGGDRIEAIGAVPVGEIRLGRLDRYTPISGEFLGLL